MNSFSVRNTHRSVLYSTFGMVNHVSGVEKRPFSDERTCSEKNMLSKSRYFRHVDAVAEVPREGSKDRGDEKKNQGHDGDHGYD